MGWPIAHSLSPRLHGHWLGELGIDGHYVPLAVRREDFATVVLALRSAGVKGVNVTVPHKEAAFALATAADADARLAGAANLLVFRDGAILARNTDAEGLAASIGEALDLSRLAGRNAFLLGAGGAARASLLALDRLGVGEIKLVNRHKDRAASLATELGPRLKAKLRVEAWENRALCARDSALIVNATSAGMTGNPPVDLSLDQVSQDTAVCDLVYNPLETDLLTRARALGLRTIDGLGMLMHQAVPSFEAFFGVRPRVTQSLRLALEAVLRNGG
jgi:shikimate dehydrogenase